ncbi:hypothetical protein E1A91_D07G050000v1 [Gossypium mustelinum]|uniref:Uncharacterized protein n=1 Tax=Gossypium mustelinum TaxID=34275 RepID=A0A5D2U3V1_GOSMU|nr:hypothetical protein E1A91_D07G050000v1 [Gossypium mustelinum]
MARGIPNYDDGGSFYDHTGGGGGSGGQYFTQSSSLSTSSSSDSLYHSSINRGTIGDVFFGTDDIRDTRDLLYKEDVLESYQKETAQKYLRQRSKKRSISNFGERHFRLWSFRAAVYWKCFAGSKYSPLH